MDDLHHLSLLPLRSLPALFPKQPELARSLPHDFPPVCLFRSETRCWKREGIATLISGLHALIFAALLNRKEETVVYMNRRWENLSAAKGRPIREQEGVHISELLRVHLRSASKTLLSSLHFSARSSTGRCAFGLFPGAFPC